MTTKWVVVSCAVGCLAVTSCSDADLDSMIATERTELASPSVAQGSEIVIDGSGHVTTSRPSPIKTGSGDLGLRKAAGVVTATPAGSKIDDRLSRAMVDAKGADVMDVVVGVKEANDLQPLPELPNGIDRDSPEGRTRLKQIRDAFDAMMAPRKVALARAAKAITARGGEVTDLHLVASSLSARVRRDIIPQLVNEADLTRFAPRFTDPPPVNQDSNPDNDAIDARARIASDAYWAAGYTGSGFTALLDTGVRNSHNMLQVPDPILVEEDCYHGGVNCNNSSLPGWQPSDVADHGTRSAGIISGTANLGANWRGITNAWIDSFRISGDVGGGTDSGAVLRAYDRVPIWSDWLVVATIQVAETVSGDIATGAANLFNMGKTVIASNGNFTGQVTRSPAISTKVLGVGGYNVATLASIGGTAGSPDGRFKPDIVMPSNVETSAAKSASGASFCDVCLAEYTGTSCAAPVAAGAANLLRTFLTAKGLPSAPGNIYAGLIAFGDQPASATNGAGKVSLGRPTCSRWMVGQATLSNGQFFDVPFSPDTGESDLNAAIWWPENPGSHRDLDMRAVRPDGTGVAFSTTIPSVFERISVPGPLVAGNWNVRINGFSIPFGTQVVYYLVHTKKPC